jgi:PTS system mannose-specific IIA component
MIRIALVMHEPLGDAFAACAAHVLGRPPEMLVFDVAPDTPPEDAARRLAAELAQPSVSSVLVLCDIFGATPFNIAKRALNILDQQGVSSHIVTGTNLCMVLKALTEQQENPEKLSEDVRLGAVRGIVAETSKPVDC